MGADIKKTEGHVFTPAGVVTIILDSVRYTGESVLNKTIMEPSFGKGAFLTEIVSRIIHEAKAKGKPLKNIRDIIDKHVYGIEKNEALYREAIQRLNELLASYDIPLPSWRNLICGDTLLIYKKYIGRMDLCVGNPPFVRIHNIAPEYRDTIKNFQFAGGTTDLYVIFYEIGIRMLKEGSGRLAYITPHSFLRNVSQKKFRNYIVDQGLLAAIYDFRDSKIFDADTYTCICVMDKNTGRSTGNSVEYREYSMYDMIAGNTVTYDSLRNQMRNSVWNIASKDNIDYIRQNAERPVKFKDIAVIQNGISTNRDSVYIGKAWLDKDCTQPYMGRHTDENRLIYFNGHIIESAILHRCVKGSKYDGIMSNTYILYPYHGKAGNKILRISDSLAIETAYEAYTEEEMQSWFSNAYEYLQENRASLATRDMDANTDWFEFARSQGLVNSGYRKLVFKNTICRSSDTVDVHVVEEDVIVYTGLYTTIDPTGFIYSDGSGRRFDDISYNTELEKVRQILASTDFHKYCVLVGKDMQGGYVAISSVRVKNYGTSLTNTF